MSSAVSKCRLLLLGPPCIETDGRASRIKLRKAIALVAYLAVEQRTFSREYLATLLWPDLGQSRALANLRRTLLLLRRTLTDGCIVTEGDHVQLNRSLIDVDIDEFHTLSRPSSSNGDLAWLEVASELYRGSFLEGFNLGNCLEFDHWQDAIRKSLQLELDALLETLSVGYLQMGQPEPALPHARRWLGLDQWNEAAHRALMEVYARTGRKSAAHKQFESCTHILAEEGIEPEELTLQLNDAIIENRLPPSARIAEVSTVRPERPSTKKRQDRPRRLRRRLAYVGAAALVTLATVAWLILASSFSRTDLMVAALEVLKNGDELEGVRVAFQNDGNARRKTGYSVVFSTDGAIATARDFVVYSDEIQIGRNAEVTVEINSTTDIQQFVDRNDVRIPPANYSLRVYIDPEDSILEHSEFNNRLASSDRFFYAGATAVEVIEVEITYSGQMPLDDANPLKVFIGDLTQRGDRTQRPGADDWGQFRVTSEGRYFFPLDEIPRRDSDGSGYFMVIVYDAADDLQNPYFTDPGDVAGFYKEVPDNVVYGGFNVAYGTPMHPGGRYSIRFSVPPLPAPDDFEIDDYPELATVLDYADLPLRQHHTFHDEGSGDIDYDWFQIFLRNGESFTVETFSAGGRWESDTAIDFNDSANYIRSNQDKSFDDNYSKLAYVNDTGVDQVFFFLVKLFNHYNIGSFTTGEYIVEFRR